MSQKRNGCFIDYQKNIDKKTFYHCLLENYTLPMNQLLDKMSNLLGRKISLDELKNSSMEFRREYGNKGTEMMHAINYSIAMQIGDLKLLRDSKEELLKFYEAKEKNRNGEIQKEKKKQRESANEQRIESIKKDLDTILESKRNKTEIEDERLINNKRIFTMLKDNLKYLDFDKYIEYLELNFELETFTEEELDRFSETLEFFIANLGKKHTYLVDLNYNNTKDIDKIHSLIVEGDDELHDQIKNNTGRLYSWKMKKIKNTYLCYKELLEIVKNVQNGDLEKVNPLSSGNIKLLKEGKLEFINDYYTKIAKAASVYKRHVDTLNTIRDSSKDEIKDRFKKRLVLKNNEQ